MAYLHETIGAKEPFLIVAPKSTIGNWMKEIKKWAPFFRTVNLDPRAEHRFDILKYKMQKGSFDICVTTYDALIIC